MSEQVYVKALGGKAAAGLLEDLNILDGPAGVQGITQVEVPIYAAGRAGVYYRQTEQTFYELSDHLGNVRAVINRVKNSNGEAVVESHADFYPFGWTMPGRTGAGSNTYRFGYQGIESDPETGWNAFTLRNYDPRMARWLNPDPMGQFYSPYLAMGNNPVSMIDPTGGFSGGPWDPANFWLNEVTITANRTSSSVGFLSAQILLFYVGMGDGIIDRAKGLADFVSSPGNSLKQGVDAIIQNPAAIIDMAKDQYRVLSLLQNPAYYLDQTIFKPIIETGDLYASGHIVGGDAFDVGMELATFGAGKGVGKLSSKLPKLRITIDPNSLGSNLGNLRITVEAAGGSKNITRLTRAGNYPSWSTVKSRYWKLMNNGKVPKGKAVVRVRETGEVKTIKVSKELHHTNGRTGPDPHRFSNLEEVWPWEHAAIDRYRHTGYDFIQWAK